MPSEVARALRLVVLLTALLLSTRSTLSAQIGSESRYAAFKDSAIRSLTARVKRGEPFATYNTAHDSALRELERRLRVIIGPPQTKSFLGPGRINTDDLFPDDVGSGGLDALNYETVDHASTMLVTTRSLLAAWLTQVRPGVPRDPIAALGTPDFYTFAINTEAAVYKYATVPLAGASRLGVVAAMLVIRAQDTGPLTPDQVIVTAIRGSRVFIVTAPAAVKIAPPAACLALRDSIIALPAARKEAYLRSKIADTVALNSAIRDDDADDIAHRSCYGERVPRKPAFQKIVMQVQAIAAVLSPR